MSRRKLITMMDNATKNLPANKKFLVDVMSAIERYSAQTSRKPSVWYKPSSFTCMRGMYFTRTSAPTDPQTTDYQSVGMADTGTRRHEAIQEVLLHIKELGYDWEYVDVETYVRKKQKFGKCKTLVIKGKDGAETKLFDTALKVSFRCDGIIRRISTDEYFLFEFKNQVSFKYADKVCVDEAHVDQVTCYCTLLDLDKAFVLYENRDTCTLECPEIFEVTDKMKQELCIDKIMTCEGYVERMIAPPMTDNKKNCRWCPYKTICRKVGP